MKAIANVNAEIESESGASSYKNGLQTLLEQMFATLPSLTQLLSSIKLMHR
jgi:hypothetical protein